MSTLINNIKYVELHNGGKEVVSVAMYRRRHIFEAEDGLYYVTKKVAGVARFGTLKAAAEGIDEDPGTYPSVPKYGRINDED